MHDFCKAIILVALLTLHVNWSIAAPPISIQLGPRPMYLVDAMNDSLLKTYTKSHEKEIQACNKMFENISEKEKAAINKESKSCPSYLNFVSKNKK